MPLVFSSVCHKLELERQQHNQLKHTWQRANDQFLESQRLLMRDMQRIESVLSSEQLRQVEVIKKKDQVGHARAHTLILKSNTVHSCVSIHTLSHQQGSPQPFLLSFTVLDQLFIILPYLSSPLSVLTVDSPETQHLLPLYVDDVKMMSCLNRAGRTCPGCL